MQCVLSESGATREVCTLPRQKHLDNLAPARRARIHCIAEIYGSYFAARRGYSTNDYVGAS